ncbi:MAG: hypothetical protein JRI79_13570 [Deltaproteobacteria bacterium]|nr:hypothetical protein [Deltaproteobacteria bacterium]MBW1978974.1 hypothetical protein [Deltaproteobacteria bacterium]MBW2044478.1 hypothetical protein [Deltaproteobacteria bacterium]
MEKEIKSKEQQAKHPKPRKNKTDPYLDGRDRMNEFLKEKGDELRPDIRQQTVSLRDAFWKAYVEEQEKLDAMIK